LAHEQLAVAGLGFASWAFAKKAAVHNMEQAGNAAQHAAMVHGTAALRPARTTGDDGAHRAHHVEEGKGLDSFWGLTAPGAVRNDGSPRCVIDNGGDSSVGGELGIGWLQAPVTCTQERWMSERRRWSALRGNAAATRRSP
jgi:hypothetical protein